MNSIRKINNRFMGRLPGLPRSEGYGSRNPGRSWAQEIPTIPERRAVRIIEEPSIPDEEWAENADLTSRIRQWAFRQWWRVGRFLFSRMLTEAVTQQRENRFMRADKRAARRRNRRLIATLQQLFVEDPTSEERRGILRIPRSLSST